MSCTHIVKESPVEKTARVMQLSGMFDLPESKISRVDLQVNLPLEEKPWNVGLIVGPSGCGKSTIARELFAKFLCNGFDWSKTKSIIDGFPAGLGIKEITGLLSSVGFSSPPAWLRPFQVLSNGEQFRVTMARAMAEAGKDPVVIDEFTSVVDRTVAQIGSCAIAKTIRRRSQKLIAVTCHYDVLEWLQPDWIYQPATGEFQWRLLQRRPQIEITIERVHPAAWEIFRRHHYLDTNLHKAAKCFLGRIKGEPATFTAVLPFPHAKRPGWREHRTVCLPDFQGVGIGNAVADFVASMFAASKPYFSTTSHPAMIAARQHSKSWKLRRYGIVSANGKNSRVESAATNRLTAGFEYCGATRKEEAQRFAILGPAAAS